MKKKKNQPVYKNQDTYSIPKVFYPKYEPVGKVAIIAANIIFVILFIVFIGVGSLTEIITYLVLVLFLFVLSIGDLIHGEIFKKQYVEINSEHIKFKGLFRTRILKWDEIYTGDKWSDNSMLGIALIRKVDVAPRHIGGSTRFTTRSPFFGVYYIKVPKIKYSNIDKFRFLKTIDRKLKKTV